MNIKLKLNFSECITDKILDEGKLMFDVMDKQLSKCILNSITKEKIMQFISDKSGIINDIKDNLYGAEYIIDQEIQDDVIILSQ